MAQDGASACMKWRHDPLDIFRGSRTPAGLYARQKWLGESGTRPWQDDFHQTVRSLMSGQAEDGSWHQSPLESIRRLFGLHLTLRNMTGDIEKALDWLVRHTLNHQAWSRTAPAHPLPSGDLRGLPFTPEQTRLFVVCATLFLATVFQRCRESLIMDHYHLLSRWVAENKDDMETWPDQSNALRALIVHPDHVGGPVTAALVDRLEKIQHPSGRWPAQIPLYQTINALAHSPLQAAHRQWIKTLGGLFETQNEDGSWGHEDREWNTFLVVHALKNKGCL